MSPSGRFERSQPTEFVAPESANNGDAAQPALLQQVLKQTLAAMSSADRVAPTEMAALQSVARRNLGQPLDEGIATELVHAVLCGQSESSTEARPLWQSTARSVAQMLLEDPEAQQRLERMWSGLCEANP